MTTEIIKNEDGLVVTLKGSLDTVASGQVTSELMSLLDNNIKNVTINCCEMDYIASSGLRLLLMVRKSCKANGGDVTLLGVQSNVMEVLTITHFDRMFIIK
ncbi:STAS domain-containing protein [Sodaliphilus sp.]|uniref:STAS domain-containing protein n=1 Tax=Sodaliphilus sp. TaxID=2815818 RepID=UPI00388DE5C4